MGFWRTATTHRRKEDTLPSNHRGDDDHAARAKNFNGDKPSRQGQRQRLLRGFCSGTSSATRWRCWVLACFLLVCCSLVGTSRMIMPSSARLLQVLQLPFWPWSTTTTILPLEDVPLPCVNTTTTVVVPVERIVHVERNITRIVYNYTNIAKQPTQRACRQVFRAKVIKLYFVGCAKQSVFLTAHPQISVRRAKAVRPAWEMLRYNSFAIIR
jgi:hypothetical protein